MKVPVRVKPVSQHHYGEAASLVKKLMEIDHYGIRKMREESPDINTISQTLILKYFPTISEGVASRLSQVFMDNPQEKARIINQLIAEHRNR